MISSPQLSTVANSETFHRLEHRPQTSCREGRLLGALDCAIMALDTGDIAHAKASFQSPPALHDAWNSVGKPRAGSDRPVRQLPDRRRPARDSAEAVKR